MKKVLVLLLLSIFLASCSSASKKEINYISSVEAMEKMDNKESFFLVIGQSTCAGCIAYKPVLEELAANKNVDIFYVETDTEGAKSGNDRANVIKLFEEYLEDKINTTPTTIYVNQGAMETYEVGPVRYTQLIEWYQDKGLLGN